MRAVAVLMAVITAGFALVTGYKAEPVKAAWSGMADPENGVSQTVTCNFDSLSYVELFAGAKGSGGQYRVGVSIDGAEVMHSFGRTQTQSESWVRFDQWNTQVAFTKGKTLTLKFTRGGNDSGA